MTAPAEGTLPGHTARRAAIAGCTRCPRLQAGLVAARQREPAHHNAPVADWGDLAARVLLVGLAPGRLGANRTGRAFVGDSSSEFLFAGLFGTGFADSADPGAARLRGMRLTNVVKCWPPQNQPLAREVNACRPHLRAELAGFWTPAVRRPRVLLTLGGVAHRALWKALPGELTQGKPCPPFSHGGESVLDTRLTLISCYHTSKLNTQTGRLTPDMLRKVLLSVRERLQVASLP